MILPFVIINFQKDQFIDAYDYNVSLPHIRKTYCVKVTL